VRSSHLISRRGRWCAPFLAQWISTLKRNSPPGTCQLDLGNRRFPKGMQLKVVLSTFPGAALGGSKNWQVEWRLRQNSERYGRSLLWGEILLSGSSAALLHCRIAKQLLKLEVLILSSYLVKVGDWKCWTRS
jgi:hypothetical protein